MNRPALYVAAQCTGKRRDGRIVKGIGASQGGPFYAAVRRGARDERGNGGIARQGTDRYLT